MKIDIIVTRHPALVSYLVEQGIASEDTPVIEHATADSIRDKHVVGILPHHLSSQAASITEIPMRLTVADREAMQRGDLSLERVRQVAGNPVTYVVSRVREHYTHWLAMAAAMRHVEEHGECFGIGAGTFRQSRQEFRGLPITLIGDSAQQVFAEVIESRGVWRPWPHTKGPWLDGFGQQVADDDIGSAEGWE